MISAVNIWWEIKNYETTNFTNLYEYQENKTRINADLNGCAQILII